MAVPSARNSGLDSTYRHRNKEQIRAKSNNQPLKTQLKDYAYLQIQVRLSISIKYSTNALRSTYWNCAFLSDNFIAIRVLYNAPGTSFNVFQISCSTFSHPIGLCWSVNLVTNTQRGKKCYRSLNNFTLSVAHVLRMTDIYLPKVQLASTPELF